MLIQASKTQFSITPTNVRPIHSCLTLNSYVLNMTQRVEEKQPLQIKIVDNNNSFQSIIIKLNSKESLTRIPGSSFCHSSSSTELQNQIQEFKKQKENMCLTLQEAFKKNNQLQHRCTLRNDRSIQKIRASLTIPSKFKAIYRRDHSDEQEIREFDCRKQYNTNLESQSDPFNVTQNFGQCETSKNTAIYFHFYFCTFKLFKNNSLYEVQQFVSKTFIPKYFLVELNPVGDIDFFFLELFILRVACIIDSEYNNVKNYSLFIFLINFYHFSYFINQALGICILLVLSLLIFHIFLIIKGKTTKEQQRKQVESVKEHQDHSQLQDLKIKQQMMQGQLVYIEFKLLYPKIYNQLNFKFVCNNHIYAYINPSPYRSAQKQPYQNYPYQVPTTIYVDLNKIQQPQPQYQQPQQYYS